jgi:predicted nucleic acid-binding protein
MQHSSSITLRSAILRAARLDVLTSLVQSQRCVTTPEVRAELLSGTAEYPEISQALTLPWLGTVELTQVMELAAFARYKSELGGGVTRNMGEAAVLAWAKINGGIVIIDERAGSRMAQREGIEVHGSLWLLASGLGSGLLGRAGAEELVDSLAATGMRLPTDGRGLLPGRTGRACCPTLQTFRKRVVMPEPGAVDLV